MQQQHSADCHYNPRRRPATSESVLTAVAADFHASADARAFLNGFVHEH